MKRRPTSPSLWRKNNRCVVEVTIRGGNTLFRAQEENKEGNMRAAIDTAQEYIDRQIRKE